MSNWRIGALFPLVAAVFMGSTVGGVHAAEPKVGSSCKKVGVYFDTPNTRYVCNKEGKKLVWRVWNPTTQSAPASKQSTSSKKMNSKAPIPITLPVAPGEITFANILENVDKVAQVAFESAQKTYQANRTPIGMKSTIWVGPSTVPVGSMSAEDRIVKAMKLWSGFNQPKSIGIFFFNTKDEPMAEIAYDKWRRDNKITSGQPASMMRNDCLSNNGPGAPVASTETLKDCSGANAGVIDSIGTGVGWFGIPTVAETRADTYRLGAIEIHEFTHMVQTSQFLGTPEHPGQRMQSISPCWLQEGQAHFAGKSVASNSYSDYLKQRNGEALERRAENNLRAPRDLAGVSAYLSLETLATCQKTYSWGYATGMLAVEALSAIGGAQSTMALYALEANGHTFSESFKLVYGITWEQAQPILAKVIVKDYLVASMSGS
jgi:hypothetical protein